MKLRFRRIVGLLSALLVFVASWVGRPDFSHALDFYVDGLNGTDPSTIMCPPPCVAGTGADAPFNNACKTIQKAVDAAAACGPGPHRIFISEGTYAPARVGPTGAANLAGLTIRGVGRVVVSGLTGLFQVVGVMQVSMENLQFEGGQSALHFEGSVGTVRHCRFAGVQSYPLGLYGGSYLVEFNEFLGSGTGITHDTCTCTIVNNTFALNTVGDSSRFEVSTVTLANNIFYRNAVAIQSQERISGTADTNDFFGNTTDVTGNTQGRLRFQNGRTDDPLFIDPAALIFHLQPSSPMIGAGSPVNGEARSIGARGVGILARASNPADFGSWRVNRSDTDPTGTGPISSFVGPTDPNACVGLSGAMFKLKNACAKARIVTDTYDVAAAVGNSTRQGILKSVSVVTASNLSGAQGSRLTMDADSAANFFFAGSSPADGLPFSVTSPSSSREIRFRTSATAFGVTTLDGTLPFGQFTFNTHRFKNEDRFVQFEIVLRRDAE